MECGLKLFSLKTYRISCCYLVVHTVVINNVYVLEFVHPVLVFKLWSYFAVFPSFVRARCNYYFTIVLPTLFYSDKKKMKTKQSGESGELTYATLDINQQILKANLDLAWLHDC